MKKIIWLTLLILCGFLVNSVYISEINFKEDEFIELFSYDKLNLSNKLFYDDYGINKVDTLKEYKKSNSSFYLIVDNNFIKNNNVSNLNCTIYTTNKSSIGYYGLTKSDNNFTIELNNESKLIWEKDKNYDFNTNETLNYNLTQDKYFVYNKSICLHSNITNLNTIINDSYNNTTNNTYTNNTENNICNFSFSVNPDNFIFTDKIKFDFTTNISDFIIEYWIEDYIGNIVKNKRNTTNTNTKSYTPSDKHTNIYWLKSNLFTSNCTVFNKSLAIIFFNSSKNTNTDNEKNEDKSDILTDSYITITNLNDFKKLKTDYLNFEIYRGDTTKRTSYIYHNNKKIFSFEIGKYSKVKNKVKIDLIKGNNDIVITGFDKTQSFNISLDELKEVLKKQDSELYLSSIRIDKNIIDFNLNERLENTNLTCYTTIKRTKISNILNLQTNFNKKDFSITIDNKKLKTKTDTFPILLKLTCRYKKNGSNYFKYESLEFNYTINNEEMKIINKYNDDKKDKIKTKLITNEVKFDNKSAFLLSNLDDIVKLNYNTLKNNKNIEKTDLKEENSIYISKNIKTKENSLYIMFLGAILLLTIFITLW